VETGTEDRHTAGLMIACLLIVTLCACSAREGPARPAIPERCLRAAESPVRGPSEGIRDVRGEDGDHPAPAAAAQIRGRDAEQLDVVACEGLIHEIEAPAGSVRDA
jgi:hypothetical protein